MSFALAQALAPFTVAQLFEPERDCRALLSLATSALRFTPRVALDPECFNLIRSASPAEIPGSAFGLILDITGTERLHHGEKSLQEKVGCWLQRHGIQGRTAIAPTIGAAWALSRSAAPCNIPSPGKITTYVQHLPLALLRLDENTVAAFKQIGIDTIGALLKLPRKMLAQRFGFLVIRNLDRLLGLAEEPLTTIREPERFALRSIFDTPLVKHASLRTVLFTLFQKLFEMLQLKGRQAREFVVLLRYTTMERQRLVFSKTLTVNTAIRSLAALNQILEPFIESIRAPYGIDALSVTARQISRANHEQRALHGALREERDSSISVEELEHLLNIFVARLGQARISQVAFHESHIPESSFSFKKITASGTPPNTASIKIDRPSFLFTPPESITVLALLPDKAPLRISWRGHERRIIHGIGPERIQEEWWQKPLENGSYTRDYFKVQDTSGAWLWVYREQPGQRWFMHGMWL